MSADSQQLLPSASGTTVGVGDPEAVNCIILAMQSSALSSAATKIRIGLAFLILEHRAPHVSIQDAVRNLRMEWQQSKSTQMNQEHSQEQSSTAPPASLICLYNPSSNGIASSVQALERLKLCLIYSTRVELLGTNVQFETRFTALDIVRDWLSLSMRPKDIMGSDSVLKQFASLLLQGLVESVQRNETLDDLMQILDSFFQVCVHLGPLRMDLFQYLSAGILVNLQATLTLLRSPNATNLTRIEPDSFIPLSLDSDEREACQAALHNHLTLLSFLMKTAIAVDSVPSSALQQVKDFLVKVLEDEESANALDIAANNIADILEMIWSKEELMPGQSQE